MTYKERVEGVLDGYKNYVPELKQAIQEHIEGKVLEGRVSELKQLEPPEQYEDFAKIAGHEACTICGFNAVKFRHHINNRIKQLKDKGGSK